MRAPRGFLATLSRDVRGNTLAILAAALIPLAGLVGGGIDISRMYITKTRLQHACDAGALAGRKAMGGGTWAQNSGAPGQAALQFFDANFQSTAYGSSNLQRSFSESAGKVSGTASAVLPMTLMKIFAHPTETLTVTCDAEMRLPNTDVMFVLDNTGSMADKASSSDSLTKIESLKLAVKCFYEIVARLDTDADCTTGTPSGGTGSQVQIRFGFVPYSTNVNVGKLLPPDYFANTWNYQTREAVYTPQTTYTFPNAGNPGQTGSSKQNYSYGSWKYDSSLNQSANKSRNCPNPPSDTSPTSAGSEGAPYNVQTSQSGSTQTVTYNTKQSYSYYNYQDDSFSNKTCYYDKRLVTYDLVRTYTRTDTGVPQTTQVFSGWHYASLPVDISKLKNGSSWNDSFQWPIGANGSNRTISWDGCIEERHTVQAASYDPIPSGADDLNIDELPSQSNANTLWAPALPDLIYLRSVRSSWSQASTAESTYNGDYYNSVPYYCPAEARKLQAWPDPTAFDSYVDSLTPTGNTYHDIGLIWGARLMSPDGIFASENKYTPQGGEIERHMIFMTDGDAVSAPCDYSAYGVAFWDQRTTSDVGTASNCPNERSQLDTQVVQRFLAMCTAIKNKNITLWVISFGNGSNTTTETNLKNCATDGRYFTARDSASLQTTFASIADQISQLRLTK